MMQRMMILLAVLSLVLPNVASAKLYKCTNDQGEVVYTDQECEGQGEELKLPPSSTYTPVVIPSSTSSNAPQNDIAGSYKKLEIVAPVNDKLITSIQGIVIIGYKMTGSLLNLKGHRFGLEVDGTKLETRGITNQIQLKDLGPGTHTVRVFVVDRGEKVLITSAVTTFHMKRRNNQTSPTPGQLVGDVNLPGTFPGGGNTVPGSLGTVPGGRR